MSYLISLKRDAQQFCFVNVFSPFLTNRFWWSLLVGVDWWDAVGCTQSAAEDGIGKNAGTILCLFKDNTKFIFSKNHI